MSDTIRREPADGAPTALLDTPQDAGNVVPVGLIGLAPEGLAIADQLTQAGRRILAYDPDPALRDAAAMPGLEIAPSADDVGRRCNVVLLMLPLGEDDAMAKDVLMSSLAPGSLIIDMGPSLPGPTRRLAATLADTGIRLVDALLLASTPPVVLLGGAEADAALARPVLAPLGDCIDTGAVGSAQALSALIAELDTMPDVAGIRALSQG